MHNNTQWAEWVADDFAAWRPVTVSHPARSPWHRRQHAKARHENARRWQSVCWAHRTLSAAGDKVRAQRIDALAQYHWQRRVESAEVARART